MGEPVLRCWKMSQAPVVRLEVVENDVERRNHCRRNVDSRWDSKILCGQTNWMKLERRTNLFKYTCFNKHRESKSLLIVCWREIALGTKHMERWRDKRYNSPKMPKSEEPWTLKISALGNSNPALFIFSRAKTIPAFSLGASTGSDVTVHMSRWMTEANFFPNSKHFVEFIRCYKAYRKNFRPSIAGTSLWKSNFQSYF